MKSQHAVSRRRKVKSDRGRTQSNLRAFGKVNDVNFVYRRVLGYADQSLSTNGGGLITAQALASSASVTSCGDWASCANLYSSYRCLRIKLQVLPAYPVNTTAVTVPAAIWVVPFFNGNPPTVITGFNDSSNLRVCSGYKGYTFAVDYLTQDKGLDAHLWTPTSASITSAESFGFQVLGSATACTVSTLVWKYCVWYECEFIMRT